MSEDTRKSACAAMVLCERTSTDSQHLLSMHNIVDKLFVTVAQKDVPELGSVVKKVSIPMEVVAIFNRKGAGVEEIHETYSMRFLDPTEKTLIDGIPVEVHIGTFSRKFYVRMPLDGVPCAVPGAHMFQIFDTKTQEVLCEEPLEIVMVDESGSAINR